MKDDHVTIEDEVGFVMLMIERDLSAMRHDNKRMKYLKSIGNFIDDRGEQILSKNPKALEEPKIGEDRDETSLTDIAMVPISGMEILNEIYKHSRPESEDGFLTPMEFINRSECYTDERALKWFKSKGIEHSFEHIHVFEDKWWMVMDKADDALNILEEDCSWRNDMTNELHTGHMFDVTRKIYDEGYMISMEKASG